MQINISNHLFLLYTVFLLLIFPPVLKDRTDSALHNSDYLDNWVDRSRQSTLVRALSPSPMKEVVSPATVTSGPSPTDQRLSNVESNTRALKCLIDAMQDNSGRVTSGLKSELTRLGRLVDNLSRNYEKMDRELQLLKQKESQRTGEGLELFCAP